MTRRLDIQRRRRSLGEIRGIMNSMKTLAWLETRKLARRIGAQQAVVDLIESTAQELLATHPTLLPGPATGAAICIVIGSERGFCGDFNRTLAEAARDQHRNGPDDHWVVVGRRLQMLWPEHIATAAALDGASVAEELAAVLEGVVAEVSALRSRIGPGPLVVLSHAPEEDGPSWTPLLPPFRERLTRTGPAGLPPLLQLDPPQMLLELVDQYLFAALNARLAHALMAESHQRVVHLERATRHLDSQWEDLGRLANTLRQEEIIEEIEVILLSAEQVEQSASPVAYSGAGVTDA